MARIAISYGLGEAASGDGNGLKLLADYKKFSESGNVVNIYSALDNDIATFDEGFAHSYGCANLIKFIRNHPEMKVKKLTLIEPVVRGWWVPIVGQILTFGQWKIPDNVEEVVCYYTNSFPISCTVKKAKKFTNIPMLDYDHVSIVMPVVKLLTSAKP